MPLVGELKDVPIELFREGGGGVDNEFCASFVFLVNLWQNIYFFHFAIQSRYNFQCTNDFFALFDCPNVFLVVSSSLSHVTN